MSLLRLYRGVNQWVQRCKSGTAETALRQTERGPRHQLNASSRDASSCIRRSALPPIQPGPVGPPFPTRYNPFEAPSMSQPMLIVVAGAQAEPRAKASLHLLPCRVHHDGDVEGAASFWHPTDGPGKPACTPPRPRVTARLTEPRRSEDRVPAGEKTARQGG